MAERRRRRWVWREGSLGAAGAVREALAGSPGHCQGAVGLFAIIGALALTSG